MDMVGKSSVRGEVSKRSRNRYKEAVPEEQAFVASRSRDHGEEESDRGSHGRQVGQIRLQGTCRLPLACRQASLQLTLDQGVIDEGGHEYLKCSGENHVENCPVKRQGGVRSD